LVPAKYITGVPGIGLTGSQFFAIIILEFALQKLIPTLTTFPLRIMAKPEALPDRLPIDDIAERVEQRNQRLDLVTQFRTELEQLLDSAASTDHLEANMETALQAIDALEQGTGPVIKAEIAKVRTAFGRFAKKAGVGKPTKAAQRRRWSDDEPADENLDFLQVS
jgi:hypothetical protein